MFRSLGLRRLGGYSSSFNYGYGPSYFRRSGYTSLGEVETGTLLLTALFI